MSKISIYEVVPVPKLADKLVGTSVGGDPEDITYNFTLSELLNLFIPNIPGNTLQGVLDFGNTATQNINLTGIITTTTLNVGSTANILNSNLTGQTKITGGLYDRLNSIGTAGQVLTSTGTQVEWYTIPTVIPDLQQVLTSGNTAVNNIILTGNLSANNAALLTSTISTSLTVLGTLRDGLSSVGTNNQVLSSNVTGVRWVNLPVYSATSPLLYNSGTGVFSIQQANASQNGYLSSADWITFDGKQTAISLTTTGNSGASTLVGATINVPNYTLSGLGGVPQTRTLTINGVTFNLSADRTWTLATGVSSVSATTPLFSTGGANPDISIQQSSSSLDGYLSSTDWLTFNSKQPAGNYITSLTGEATAAGPGAASVTLSNAAVIGKLLTGLSITGSAISSSDSILTAFGKVQNQINGLIGGVQFQGVWNAATNTPALVSSVGTQGYYYIVDVAGNTNLNGITDWQVGDWAIFNGSTWNKVDNTDLVTSVNGQIGAVSLTTDNIPEGATNLYYLDSRARAALSFAAGSGAYNSTTGVITIPTDNSQILNGAGYITLVSLSATSPLSYNNLTGAFSIQVANTTQNGYLSSTDWNTFNGKQDYLNGTGLVKSVAGTISYITDNSANWNTAYNDSIVSAAVTGTATKTLTLNQQDGGTITASWSDIDTGLTSVGVSMPSAFSVANSPLTSNGTIAITGSGNTLQYVDGTGALQSFPSLTGYVPYTGATANVNLGIYNLTAASLIKNGGTSGQFLKADGSVDSSAYIVLGSLSATAPLSYNNTTGVFTISQSGASTNGYLSSTDWNTFNNKQATITLTTTGSSGASTLIGNTLNIPNYANLVTSVFGRIGAVVATEGDYSLTQLSDVTITTPSSGQVLKYNGTAWVNDIDTDTGITSLNGLTALTQTFAVGTSGTDFAISSVTSTHTFNLPTASVSNRGALSSADWTTFNSKEPAIAAGTTLQYYRGDKTFQTLNTTVVPEGTNLYYLDSRARTAISLTTTGSSGASTYNNTTGVFNIPDYGSALSGYVPTSRQLSINGTQYDLSADRSWSVGTVTTVSFTLGASGTDLNSSVTNSTTTPAITLNVPTASAANRGALSAADWSTFNTKVGGVTATTPLFSSGGSTPNLTIQQSSGSQAGYLSSTDWTTFNNKQAAGNYITSLTGEATATGPGAAAVTLDNAAVTGKILTGVNITGGTILSTDSILTGFGKLQNQVNGLIGGSIYQGTWNASTNTPTLTSSVGTAGYYYIVSVAGNTNLNGITDWQVGDWAIFNGGVWQKVDNTDSVTSVNGQTGAVSLTTDNISEGVTNLYFLNSRARSALSFVAGSGAYNSSTGAITIPTNTSQLTNGANFITLGSLSGTAPISYNSGTGAISITQSGTASNGYLSSTDWNTFNNKQATITLTTTGTSGASTLIGATLNIPQYQASGTYVTSVTGTSPIVSSGGTAPAISIPVATTSVNGYLSSTDWNTFNNKTTCVGTVTSVAANAGTGISITGSPITTSGTFCITNTSPYTGQAVIVLGGGADSSVRCGVANNSTGNYSAALGGYGNTASARYSGVVAGYGNTASGYYSFVGAGQTNTASGERSFVGGGLSNTASGAISFVGGGASNTASGNCSVIAGGKNNTASNAYTFVGGGNYSIACGVSATASGGYASHAYGNYSTVGGGCGNNALSACSTVAGGRGNTASFAGAAIVGGQLNTASYYFSFVGAGNSNIANNYASAVAGGSSNTASGYRSFVGAGISNTASGNCSVVAGGSTNIASGAMSSIAGGSDNFATSNRAAVGGGYNNTASSTYSTVSGGYVNRATGGRSFVGGGTSNCASGTNSTVAGGSTNTASGNCSVIAGGFNHTANNGGTTISGGISNTASGACSTVGGGTTNTASGTNAAVLGGNGNTASGSQAFVGAGISNTASGYDSVVGGGLSNGATNSYATVSGGYGNSASATWSTISGGKYNVASGCLSFVGGGCANTASGGYASFVGGGCANCATSSRTTVVGGYNNRATAASAFVGGGEVNLASAGYSVVSGGYSNNASGDFSTLTGGRNNAASGACSFVGGGCNNAANYNYSTVVGGGFNTSSGYASFVGAGFCSLTNQNYGVVGGGSWNTVCHSLGVECALGATVAGGIGNNTTGGTFTTYWSANPTRVDAGKYSFIGGGFQNRATASRSTIGGGCGNCASGNYSTVGGGANSTASGYMSAIAGGYLNTASNNYTVISGGKDNAATGYTSTIGGGRNNIASVDDATVGGGLANTASAYRATVGGGRANCATATHATVSGGYSNKALGTNSTVGGGCLNTAYNTWSTVAGGVSNCACGDRSAIVGGNGNLASAYISFVGGGLSNTASGYQGAVVAGYANAASAARSFVGGGQGNTASGACSTVSGGKTNTASDAYGFVGGGINNSNSGYGSFIGGGSTHTVNTSFITIAGGYVNTATALYATIGGGRNNTSSGCFSTVSGGYANTASGTRANVSSGQGNTALGACSFVGGGLDNNAVSLGSFVGGGSTNTACGPYKAAVVGGGSNTASGYYSFIGAGYNNLICGVYASTISGGYQNRIYTGCHGFIGGGRANAISGVWGAIAGGCTNTITSAYNFIGGGRNNTASGAYSAVLGGRVNTASGIYSTVAGGICNQATGGYSAILGGGNNTATGTYSGVFGTGITASASCTFYSNNFCATSCMFATAFYETSDCRLKNIHNTFSAYDGIHFSQFSWKTDTENKSCFGYIAQEVEKILPNAVHNNIEGYKQVDYNQVNTYKLSKLEDRIAKLEDKLKKYEA